MKEMFQRNLGYKAASLVLAILFWLWVTSQSPSQVLNPNETLTLSVVAKNLPANHVVMTKLPSVRVKLEGYNPSVNVNELYAYVDLADSIPGEHEYEVKMSPIPNITIKDISPSVIEVDIDTLEESIFPVSLELTGEPAEGSQLGKPIIRPESVNVRGPSRLLSQIDKVLVELNIARASQTVQMFLPVVFRDEDDLPIYGPDPSMEMITASPSSVEIIVPIVAKGMESKRIPLSASTVGNPAEGMEVRSITVLPDGAEVYGSEEDLAKVEVVSIGSVDIGGISKTTTFEVSSDRVSLPRGLTFASRMSFSVLVEVGPTIQEKTLYNVPITLRNIDPDLELKDPLPGISVTIKGYPEVLSDINSEKINIWLDAKGQKEGEHQGKFYWQLPSGVDMVSIPNVVYTLVPKEIPEDPEEPEEPSQ
ncbi:MAG: hypothetical protein GX958_06700 [Desulfitobacterium sp.]|nr:hypothetical protein [Desulfitobacterium sp.]